jgi:hypothetical protein
MQIRVSVLGWLSESEDPRWWEPEPSLSVLSMTAVVLLGRLIKSATDRALHCIALHSGRVIVGWRKEWL